MSCSLFQILESVVRYSALPSNSYDERHGFLEPQQESTDQDRLQTNLRESALLLGSGSQLPHPANLLSDQFKIVETEEGEENDTQHNQQQSTKQISQQQLAKD